MCRDLRVQRYGEQHREVEGGSAARGAAPLHTGQHRSAQVSWRVAGVWLVTVHLQHGAQHQLAVLVCLLEHHLQTPALCSLLLLHLLQCDFHPSDTSSSRDSLVLEPLWTCLTTRDTLRGLSTHPRYTSAPAMFECLIGRSEPKSLSRGSSSRSPLLRIFPIDHGELLRRVCRVWGCLTTVCVRWTE